VIFFVQMSHLGIVSGVPTFSHCIVIVTIQIQHQRTLNS